MKDSNRKAMFAKRWNNASDGKKEKILRTAYRDLDFPSHVDGHPSPNLTQRDVLNDIVLFHGKTKFNDLPSKVKTRIVNIPNWKMDEIK